MSTEQSKTDQTKEVLEGALRAAGVGTWRWDLASGVVTWDHTLEALCGIEPGAFGRNFDAWLATLHPDERQAVQETVQDALERRAPYEVEHRTVWPDGTIRWLHCHGAVTTNAEGEPTGTTGCAVDITDRRNAEARQGGLVAELRAAADRLHRLQRLSGQLTRARDVDDVVRAVMDHLDAPAGA